MAFSKEEADKVLTDYITSLSKESKTHFEALCTDRRPKRSAVTKAINSANPILADPSNPKEALQYHYDRISEANRALDKEDEKVWRFLHSDRFIQADTVLGMSYTNQVSQILIKLQSKINRLTATLSTSVSPTSPAAFPAAPAAAPAVKLPKVELPVFTGESPAEYQTFINQFNSLVHNSASIDDIQKLLYLKNCCKGEAKRIADGFNCTAENYKNLYDIFKETYGKPRLILQSHADNILELEGFKNHSMKAFLNTLETSLRCMGEHKIDPEHLSPLLVPMIEKKMPRDVFIKWREVIHEDKDFSTTKLISFLHERVECLPSSTSSQPQPHKDEKSSQQKDTRPKTTSLLTAASKENPNCRFCKANGHSIDVCRNFGRRTPKEKEDWMKDNKTCFKCLRQGHWAIRCRSDPLQCERCQDKHPTSLHNFTPTQQPQKAKTQGTQPPSLDTPREVIQKEQTESVPKTVVSTVKTASHNRESTLLKSFQAIASNGGNGQKGLIRALMDDGSQNSWITSDQVKSLNLPIIGTATYQVAVAFTGGYSAPQQFPMVEVDLETTNGSLFTIKATVREEAICADLAVVDFIPQEKFSHLRKIQLADDYPRGEDTVDLLIGGDYCEAIRTGQRKSGKLNEPIAVETLFGWIIGGPCEEKPCNTTACHNVATIPFHGIEETLKKFYETESLPTEQKEASSFREDVRSTIEFDPQESRYTISIPYKSTIKQLQSNKELALAMTKKQEQRLSKNPKLEQQVKEAFQKQLEAGVIEEVVDDDPTTQKHYLPWHTVVREGHPTTPMRVVMNASQKDKNGLSLNNCQEAGPNLLPDVGGLAMKFQNNPIGLIMDISKMFFQIKIPKSQKDLHRFFAFQKVFRQAKLLFGEASSPYLAAETVSVHAEAKFNELRLAAEAVKDQLYIDDTITGSKTKEEAIQLVTELIQLFKTMSMKVHKINSNNKKVLEAFDPDLLENVEVSSILGIEWDTQADTLALKQPNFKNECSTKREFLATLASIYDPLGFQAPLTCWGKSLMQAFWAKNFDWDSKIPDNLVKQLKEWLRATSDIPKFPRFWGEIETIHVFCDASENAYAAVAYGASKEGQANFIMAKTRVKPLKEMTIPRLELQGAVLAANMSEYIQEHLGKHVVHFWTDSSIVLGWIKSDTAKYKVFVGNRIKLIQQKTKTENWKWVPGAENPADIPSRGLWPLNQQQLKLWQHGPEFIINGCHPEQPPTKQPTEEIKKTATQVVNTSLAPPIIELDRFSNINRLLNATAYVFRFINRKTGASGGPLTATERGQALQKIIKIDQQNHFAEDLADLKEGQLKRNSKIRDLNPTLGEDGILRMQGRVATEPDLIILHSKSHLASLIIREAHKKNLHSGVSHTLNDIRSKYWILKGFATTKQALKACVTCQKTNNRLAGQQMSTLPEWRTTPSPPFAHTGVDYAGPLYITKKGNLKRYILLFTCGVTRAVHLELTQTLDTKDFLLAFECFTARRGVPSAIYSDNGTTFVAAAKALPSIKWQFIPPFSPWHGGFWERIVRSIKTPLRKIAGGAKLKETELRTLLTKIEGVINSRPLTSLSSGDSHRVITPMDLLSGRPLQQQDAAAAAPSMDFVPTRRLQHLQEVQGQFWRQWRANYLPTLQQRPKWDSTKPEIKEGDIVLLLKENEKRNKWPLAKVIETIKGRDGLVRTIRLLCDGKELTRPCQLIVPLEVQSDKDRHTESRD